MDTATGYVHPIGKPQAGNARALMAMTPSTRALLAALGSAAPDSQSACVDMMREGRCDAGVLVELTARDTCAALETLRHRHNAHYKAIELVKACVLVQRWVDRLASAPGDPDMSVYRALYAVLLRRLVIDGASIAAETLTACQRAAEAAVNPPLDPAFIAIPSPANSGESDVAAATEH